MIFLSGNLSWIELMARNSQGIEQQSISSVKLKQEQEDPSEKLVAEEASGQYDGLSVQDECCKLFSLYPSLLLDGCKSIVHPDHLPTWLQDSYDNLDGLSIIKHYIELGADPNTILSKVENNLLVENMRLLHIAAEAASVSIVQYLLDHGANPYVRDVNEDTPLDLIKKNSFTEPDGGAYHKTLILLQNAMADDSAFDDYLQADEELAQAGFWSGWYNLFFA